MPSQRAPSGGRGAAPSARGLREATDKILREKEDAITASKAYADACGRAQVRVEGSRIFGDSARDPARAAKTHPELAPPFFLWRALNAEARGQDTIPLAKLAYPTPTHRR
jgi:hypothetical protein